MANEPLASNSGKVPPIAYVTAVWAGMSHDAIVAGLQAGTILGPPGSPAGWLPPAGSASESIDTASPVDRGRVLQWLTAIDPTLAAETFDSIWQHAGADDAARAASLTKYLANTLLGSQGAVDASVPAAIDTFVADSAHVAQVVDLADFGGADIARLAQGDIGYRHALDQLAPFAMVGNRSFYSSANADGHLNRFDPDSGESLVSDAWLEDRGKFLAWKIDGDEGNDVVIAGGEDWTFIDRRSIAASGKPLTIELKSGAADAGSNQVVFGSDDVDVIRGVSGSDRLYGAGGDDVLRGGAGGDHLEGGAGDDLLMGGAGNDELVGNQGDDEIEGGTGADHLTAGSGSDYLAGGRGDDRLEGGAGFDTYVVDAGDGHDTIVDADGTGTIELDGTALRGTMNLADSRWMSESGQVEFTFSGDQVEGGTLAIRDFAPGADHAGAPANIIDVKNWKNGDLGITLAGDPAVSSSTGAAAATGNNGSEANANASDDSGQARAGQEGNVPDGAVAADVGNGATTIDAAGDGMSAGSDDGGSASDDADATAIIAKAGAFDFDDALESLLGTVPPTLDTIDPVTLSKAIDAFSGVLEPPDVSDASADSLPSDAGMVTAAHVADAMANDMPGDDLDVGMAMPAALSLPDVLRSDRLDVPYEKTSGVLPTLAEGQR